MLQCPYCEEDAETCGHWDSFDDCRFYLGKIAPMVSALKARIAELEAIGRAYAWCNNLPHASQLFGLRVFDHDEDGDFIWSPWPMRSWPC